MNKITALALLIWVGFVAIAIGAVVYTEPRWIKWFVEEKPQGIRTEQPQEGQQTTCAQYILNADGRPVGIRYWHPGADGLCHQEATPR